MEEKYQFEFDIDEAVRRYADMVYRLALLNVKNHSDAEDVFRENKKIIEILLLLR